MDQVGWNFWETLTVFFFLLILFYLLHLLSHIIIPVCNRHMQCIITTHLDQAVELIKLWNMKTTYKTSCVYLLLLQKLSGEEAERQPHTIVKFWVKVQWYIFFGEKTAVRWIYLSSIAVVLHFLGIFVFLSTAGIRIFKRIVC